MLGAGRGRRDAGERELPDSGEGTPTSSGQTERAAVLGRRRVTLAIAIATGAALVAIVAVRWLRDGSFWLDEASVAINLLAVAHPLDLLGPLPTGHSFPRLYLVPIALMERAFGFDTLLLRAWPFVFFLAGVAAWLRVVWLRVRDQPALMTLIAVLAFVPATWLVYGAMFKQYSLDVLLALLPFLLSDDWYEQRIREGRGRARLVWLAAPMLFSFTYAIALLGRLAGWWLAGLRFARRRVEPRALATLLVSLLLGGLALWLIDLRHTAARSDVFAFWSRCIPGEVGVAGTGPLILDLIRGWYTGTPFGGRPALPDPLAWAILAAVVLGSVETVRRSLQPASIDSPTLARWGSRSLGCLALVAGVVGAGVVADYPICRGRLTLFALFALQILTVEGFYALGAWGGGGRRRRALAAAVTLAFTALVAPAAWRNAHHLVVRDVPENVRPLLAEIESEPSLPILVAECSTRQLATLPEWLDDPRVVYYEERVAKGLPAHPDAADIWVISAGTNFYCPWYLEGLRAEADSVVPRHTRDHTAQLFRVSMPARRDPL